MKNFKRFEFVVCAAQFCLSVWVAIFLLNTLFFIFFIHSFFLPFSCSVSSKTFIGPSFCLILYCCSEIFSFLFSYGNLLYFLCYTKNRLVQTIFAFVCVYVCVEWNNGNTHQINIKICTNSYRYKPTKTE